MTNQPPPGPRQRWAVSCPPTGQPAGARPAAKQGS